MSKHPIFLDTHENLTVGPFEEKFDITLHTLPVGDVYHFYKPILIEVKVGKDVHDYARLNDELHRMNVLGYNTPDLQMHLLYCDTYDYIMPMAEYKLVVMLCCQNGVFPHHCRDMAALVDKMQDIFDDKYQNRLYVKPPPKQINDVAKMLCSLKGITPDRAVGFSEICPIPDEIGIAIKAGFLDDYFGLNKDGSQKALTKKFTNFWFKGKWE